MKIRFWGVRGSIPCPGPNTVSYGGNTACIELRFTDPERLIIIDAGSGIRELGNFMMGHDLKKGPIATELFLSHTHWDHIMGFPFFTPIYIPGTRIRIYGPVTHEESLEKIVGGQLTYKYFPVRDVELAAKLEYIHLKEGRFDLGDGIVLVTKYLNHPILCLGFRFEHRGKVFCTAYDTEPFRNIFCCNPDDPDYDEMVAEEGRIVAEEQNRLIEQFVAGADLLVYDTQYTKAEYEQSRIGWGHSSHEDAIAMARAAGVKAVALFHHDPTRTDAQIEEVAQRLCPAGESGCPRIFFAREAMEIEL